MELYIYVYIYMRSEVSIVTNNCIAVLWVMTPFSLVGRYQCFEETYCVHLQDMSGSPVVHFYSEGDSMKTKP
jgi:hypothetical protein